MGIKLKLLLLVLPLVVCTKPTCDPPLHPYIDRFRSLTTDMMIFFMGTASLNYDAHFFAPALVTLMQSNHFGKENVKFFAKDFKLTEHANDFRFSETETREEFAKRFIRYIANAKNIPSNIRDIAARFPTHIQKRPWFSNIRGFIKPFPLYSFVRAVSLIEELHKLGDVDINSVEVIIKFLLTEFNPLDYNIEDNANVLDIVATIEHGLGDRELPVKLLDGSLALQCNKELFERLATKEYVPQLVKDAIADVLPHM